MVGCAGIPAIVLKLIKRKNDETHVTKKKRRGKYRGEKGDKMENCRMDKESGPGKRNRFSDRNTIKKVKPMEKIFLSVRTMTPKGEGEEQEEEEEEDDREREKGMKRRGEKEEMIEKSKKRVSRRRRLKDLRSNDRA